MIDFFVPESYVTVYWCIITNELRIHQSYDYHVRQEYLLKADAEKVYLIRGLG